MKLENVAPRGAPRRVLFLEFNEITWTILTPLLRRGKLPHLARMCEEGARSTTRSVDLPPHLDPWVTWVTVHTGVSRSTHGATVLEQDAGTIGARRTWEYAVDGGKRVGVFGSIGSHPPRPVPGFMVPGPFAPDDATYPRRLQPIQRLNREQTHIHNGVARRTSFGGMIEQAASLLRCGLTPGSVARIGAQLTLERARPHLRWRRICLQPLINFDFFADLYRRHHPHFATFHTNHAAHMMHRYWRAYDDSEFPRAASEEEKRKFGDAVPAAYEAADELLGRFLRLAGGDTVVVLASSMGQRPYVSQRYRDGRRIVSFRDVRRFLEIAGVEGVTEVQPVMMPQWNVRIPDPGRRAAARGLLSRAHRSGKQGEARDALSVAETGDLLTLTPKGLAGDPDGLRYFFPGSPNARAEGYSFDELFALREPTPKQGMHDPAGVLVFWGAGVPRGRDLGETSTLDVAPTLLSLLGLPVPRLMEGRVLSEIAPRAAADPPRSASRERSSGRDHRTARPARAPLP